MTKLTSAVNVSEQAARYMAGFKAPAENKPLHPGYAAPDSICGQAVQAKRAKPSKLTTALATVKPSAAKPFTKFEPGPWTLQLLFLANPGMRVDEAGRHLTAIYRAHATASAGKEKASTATRPTKKAAAIVAGACA